jgi:signal transduction histidine kinase
MPCPAPPRRPQPGRLLAGLPAGLLLPGCAGTGPGDGLWAVAAVALGLGGLAAALAFALGRRSGPAPRAATPSTRPDAASPTAPPPGTAPPAALADALPGPALLLLAQGTGWRLLHANAEARRAWPALLEGSDPPPWPDGLLAQLDGGPADTWHSVVVPGPPRWALAWQAAAAATGVKDASTAAETAALQAASDSFGFTLSHDLRAPLRVVEGFTRIVKEDYGAQLDRVGNDHLERVLGAAARMNLMIDAMLALARLSQQPLTRQPVNLSQLAAFVVEDLRRGEPEHAVEFGLDPELTVQGDPTLLRLVLENLLGNAWKYSARAVAPQVELRREAAAAGQLGFVVRDNGAGFDMRSADRLFGLFQRLHSASDFPGHGVGLASVRRIVERHGGRVWAESEPGKGASFHVVLPA